MRTPKRDPQAGDVVIFPNGDTATVQERRMRRRNEYGIGNAKDLVFYRLKAHKGGLFNMGVSGWRKRCVDAEVLHVAAVQPPALQGGKGESKS